MQRPFFLLFLLLPLIVGCEGCRNDSADPKDDEEKEQAALSDFTPRPSFVFPADEKPGANAVKPGHWLTASQSLKSNKFDSRGELVSQATTTNSNIERGQKSTTEYGITSRRPVVLPKGQMRRFDYRLLAPTPMSANQPRMTVGSRFISTGRGTFFDTGRQPFDVMKPQEYFFVVLSSRPQRFTRMQVADWVRSTIEDGMGFTDDRYANYRLVFPSTEGILPLAETMLDWTATSVLLWDDLDANKLTPDQQKAIMDWIHFGGQLIVNGGPASDALSKTQLAGLLPMQPKSAIELDPDSVVKLLSGWGVPKDPSTQKQIALAKEEPGIGLDGVLADDAQSLPGTGNLVVDRVVGRGRVVQTRFDLTADWIREWESYNSFVNGAILARPRREFKGQGSIYDSIAVPTQRFADLPNVVTDARLNSSFRLFARDATLRMPVVVASESEIDDRVPTSFEPAFLDELTFKDPVCGTSSWTDSSDTVSLYNRVLKEESGIEIPQSSLVVKSLGWYLLFLVPINYIVFRLMGRLEYAWLAVPFIAMIGAMWVARAARLDIGFARSQTELALLELPTDYSRGHLTRVVAIYNSLSTRYELQFKTTDGAAMPMNAASSNSVKDDILFLTSYNEGPSLTGITVNSNDTEMMHSEEMVDVGGGIRLEDGDLVNGTKLELLDAYVVKKDMNGRTQIASVGVCLPDTTVALRFSESQVISVTEELPMQSDELLRRFASPASMMPGSARLVGRVDQSLEGLTITPSANQKAAQTIVLAHLQYAPKPELKPDINVRSQFVKEERKRIDSELEADFKSQ